MRRLASLLLLVLGVFGCAHGKSGGALVVAAFSETQTCTAGTCARSAPTSTAEGMELYSVQGFRLEVCAPTGQTLSGAGAMLAYWCDSKSGACARNPALDQAVTASGVQCQAFPDFNVSAVQWYDASIVFAASGVTVSSGTPLTVYLFPGGPK